MVEGGGGRGKVERIREQHREWQDLFQYDHENSGDQKGGEEISH